MKKLHTLHMCMTSVRNCTSVHAAVGWSTLHTVLCMHYMQARAHVWHAANLGPCTCCKTTLVSEDNCEDGLQKEGHCCVHTKYQSVVVMFHVSGELNSAVV